MGLLGAQATSQKGCCSHFLLISPPPPSHPTRQACLPACLPAAPAFLRGKPIGGKQGSRAWSSAPLPLLPGLPKAARISHLKILQCQAFYQLCGAHQEDIIYLALPLYHMSGSLLGIVGCLGIGQSPAPPSVVCLLGPAP